LPPIENLNTHGWLHLASLVIALKSMCIAKQPEREKSAASEADPPLSAMHIALFLVWKG